MENRIKEARLAKGWSQEKLAAEARTSFQQISRLEKGERKFTMYWMETLGKALQVPPLSLLKQDGINSQQDEKMAHNQLEFDLLRIWRKLSVDMRTALMMAATAFVAATQTSGPATEVGKPDDIIVTHPDTSPRRKPRKRRP